MVLFRNSTGWRMGQEIVRAGAGRDPLRAQQMALAEGLALMPKRPQNAATAHLTGQQKAAVIVRLLLAEGGQLPLTSLPDSLQTELTTQIAAMRLIDRATLDAVVEEFLDTLDQVGLAFSDGLHGALSLLGDHISEDASERLRAMLAQSDQSNPWGHVEAASDQVLSELLNGESPQIGAVTLSRLSTKKASAVLSLMEGGLARRVALAMAHTERISPQVVHRIGQALARQIDARPKRAFASDASRRVGEILDISPAPLRDSMLSGIEAEDADFARGVRRAIFTYGDFPERLAPLDVPRLVRELDQEVLLTVLSGTLGQKDTRNDAASEFILANLSQRLGATLREEAEMSGSVNPRDLDSALKRIVATVRGMAQAGDIKLVQPEED